jgi:4-hydroxybenzoate polyprenyltransferase
MQSPTTKRKTQVGAAVFVVGILFIFLPIIVSVVVGGQPFPGTVVGPSEVAPVLGLLFCVISGLMIIQDNFGY